MSGTSTSTELTAPPPAVRPHRRLSWIVIVLAVLGALLVSVAAILVFEVGPPIGPSSFAPASIVRRAPGSPGCRAVAGDICYLAQVESTLQDLQASDLFFAVNGTGPWTNPVTRSIGLGPGASVSLLSNGSVAGVWNYTRGTWTLPPTGDLPVSGSFSVVLDTGLDANSTFAGAYFWVQHSSPSTGSVGFPL